jgi:hypothetical protein
MRIERSDGTVVIRLHGEGELERAISEYRRMRFHLD